MTTATSDINCGGGGRNKRDDVIMVVIATPKTGPYKSDHNHNNPSISTSSSSSSFTTIQPTKEQPVSYTKSVTKLTSAS
eukprot:13902757-Ditylum_brightwellii.AAC.1